ncbi:MAG TPA: DUF1598 domain-containing protein [Pirellulales bacterium]|jgi:hypothetical protein|nr:DUF1598 domain-containing protein [Pirellulales bacterium]
MSLRNCVTLCARHSALLAIATALMLTPRQQAVAQFIQQQVGGVSIDARGVVTNVRIDELNELKQVREQALKAVPGDLKGHALRKISLRQLEAAISENRKNGKPISDDMRYLAGMQRIQYVFVYPEQNDIVLAGPGEGWKLNAQSEIVGITTHRPVMLLDDLLVALRSIDMAERAGISCSIDPTAEGLSRLQSFFRKNHTVDSDPTPMLPGIEQMLGPQTIRVTGVPDTSHFARVLVAADYRMKRLAMAFEEPPIAGLPNFLQMIKSSSKSARPMLPRWWLAPDYDALLADADALAWELRGAGVKALTEEEAINSGGERQRTGQANPLAKKWADNMTAHYDELSTKDAIFGQLRNCMDLAVVAALISKENLTEKCGWSMPLLLNPDLLVESYNAPHQVDSQASMIQKGSTWIVSASGGVQIVPRQLLEKTVPSPALGSIRAKSAAASTAWWWN